MKRSPMPRPKRDREWEEAREQALIRDGYWPVCPRYDLPGSCYGGIDVHHILPRRRGGKHNLENLVTTCSRHHRWIHEHPAEAYELGLLARSGDRNDRGATASSTVMELASSDERARGAEAP